MQAKPEPQHQCFILSNYISTQNCVWLYRSRLRSFPLTLLLLLLHLYGRINCHHFFKYKLSGDLINSQQRGTKHKANLISLIRQKKKIWKHLWRCAEQLRWNVWCGINWTTTTMFVCFATSVNSCLVSSHLVSQNCSIHSKTSISLLSNCPSLIHSSLYPSFTHSIPTYLLSQSISRGCEGN